MAVTILSPAYGNLAALTVAVMDYYCERGPMPPEIAQILPCVGDALASHDDDYIELMHGLFGIALENVMLCQKGRKDEACLQQLNIVKASLDCHGPHVDTEYRLVNGRWRRYRHSNGAVVETIERQKDETDIAFFDRVNARASQLDRKLNCSHCLFLAAKLFAAF